MTEVETDDRQLLGSVQRISDRQMLLHKDVNQIIKRTRDEAWWNMERECERLDMKFDEAKVVGTWEYRLELLTEPDPERLKRREVLKAWSEQKHPIMLAPMHNMAEVWLSMNRDLISGLTKKPKVYVSGHAALAGLRGYKGTLLIVKPGPRPHDPTALWSDFYRTIHEITLWERFSIWTDTLP